MQPDRVRWVDENKKRGALTASSFGCALGLKGRVYHYVDYLRNYADTDYAFRGNLATFHGQRTEDISKMVYERLINGGRLVDDGGFFVCPEHPTTLAATPDGIVSWRPGVVKQLRPGHHPDEARELRVPLRLLEIKSPVASLYDCSREDNTVHGVPRAYMCQMQGQIFFTGADECDFFVFVARHPPELACWRVYRSQPFYDWMLPKLLQVAAWVAAPKGTPTHELLPLDFRFPDFDFSSVRVEPVVMPSNVPRNLPIRDHRRFAWFFLPLQQQNANAAANSNNNNNGGGGSGLPPLRVGASGALYHPRTGAAVDPQLLVPLRPQPPEMADAFLQLIATRALREGDWVLWQKDALATAAADDEDAEERHEDGRDDGAQAGETAMLTSPAKARRDDGNGEDDDSGCRIGNPTQLSFTGAGGLSPGGGNTDASLSQQPRAPPPPACRHGIPRRSPSVQLTPSRCCCCGHQPPQRAHVPSVAPTTAAAAAVVPGRRQHRQQEDDGAAATADAAAKQQQQNGCADDDFHRRVPHIARVVRLHADTGLVELEVLLHRPVAAAARALARSTSSMLLVSAAAAAGTATPHTGGGSGGVFGFSSSESSSLSSLPSSPFLLNTSSKSGFATQGGNSGDGGKNGRRRNVSHFTPSLALLKLVLRCRVCGGEDELGAKRRRENDGDSGNGNNDDASIAEQQQAVMQERMQQQQPKNGNTRFTVFHGIDTRDATQRVFADPATDSIVIVRRRGRPVRDEEEFWRKSNPNSLSWSVLSRGGAASSTVSPSTTTTTAKKDADASIFAVDEDDAGSKKEGDVVAAASVAEPQQQRGGNRPPPPPTSHHRFYNALTCELIQQLWHSPVAVLLRTPTCHTAPCLIESLRQLRLIVGGELLRVPPKSAAALWHIASMLASPLSPAQLSNSQSQQQQQQQQLDENHPPPAGACNNTNAHKPGSGSSGGGIPEPVMRSWVADSFQLSSVCHKMFLRTVQAAGSVQRYAMANSICAVMTMRAFQSVLSSGAGCRKRASPLMPPPSPVVLRRIFTSPQYEEDPEGYMEAMGEGDSIGAWAFNNNTSTNAVGDRGVAQPQQQTVGCPPTPPMPAPPPPTPMQQTRPRITRFHSQSTTSQANADSQVPVLGGASGSAGSFSALGGGGSTASFVSSMPTMLAAPPPAAAAAAAIPVVTPTTTTTTAATTTAHEPLRTDVWKSPVWIVCSEEENSDVLPDIYDLSVGAAKREVAAPWIWFVN